MKLTSTCVTASTGSPQQRGPVNPLLDGLLRGGNKQRVAVDERDIADMPVLRNDHVEAHHALDPGLLGGRRIDGINGTEQVRLLDSSTHADALDTTRRRCSGRFSLAARSLVRAEDHSRLDASRDRARLIRCSA